jgi:hypothetical protein
LLNVRFAPKATELLQRREMTLRANTGHCGLFDHLVGAGERHRRNFERPSVFAAFRPLLFRPFHHKTCRDD